MIYNYIMDCWDDDPEEAEHKASEYMNCNNLDAFEEGYRRGRTECYKEIEHWKNMTLFWEHKYNELIKSLPPPLEPTIVLWCNNAAGCIENDN